MRGFSVLVVTAALALAAFTSAAPASAQGAETFTEPFQERHCNTDGEYRICFTVQGVTHVTRHADGSFSYNTQYRQCFDVRGPDTSYRECTRERSFGVEQERNQVSGYAQQYQFSLNPPSGETVRCTYSYRIVFANGAVRAEGVSRRCS